MKIATVSENGNTISQHFGRAPLYVVLTVENGQVVGRETRVRGQQNICGCHHDPSSGDCHSSHGQDTSSQSKHAGMVDAIADCQVLIAGGMGYGAYESLKSRNVMPIITDVPEIDEAVRLFVNGKLANLMEYLH